MSHASLPGGRATVLILAGSAILLCAALVAFFIARALQTPATDGVTPPVQTTDDDDDKTTTGTWPIFITTMTHLEGSWAQAADNAIFFDHQATLLRHGMDIAEDYDAVLTIESEIPMAQGMLTFDDNILQEAIDRGHGAGTHCDISAKTHFTDVQMVSEFAKRKRAVDALIGEENNFGCSGGGGYGDWFVGAVAAGLKYIDGGVGYHYLALPLSERPEGWTDDAIISTYFHDPAPQIAGDFFHPFRINTLGFNENAGGDLLMSGGTLPRVENLDETGGWTLHEDTGCPRGVCKFTQDDVESAVSFLETFIENESHNRPAKITFYFATEAFDAKNDSVLKSFFAAMQKFVDNGDVTWATQREVYETMNEYYGE